MHNIMKKGIEEEKPEQHLVVHKRFMSVLKQSACQCAEAR